MFGAIPSDHGPAVTFSHLPTPFDMPSFNRIVSYKPVRTVHEVELYWCFPSILEKYRSKPLAYISEMMGHEGRPIWADEEDVKCSSEVLIVFVFVFVFIVIKLVFVSSPLPLSSPPLPLRSREHPVVPQVPTLGIWAVCGKCRLWVRVVEQLLHLPAHSHSHRGRAAVCQRGYRCCAHVPDDAPSPRRAGACFPRAAGDRAELLPV